MVKRGEIYWLELPQTTGSEQAGRRPVLIVQNDVGNRSSPVTIVAAITSQPRRRRYPFHVPVTAKETGLRLDGTVLCEQVQTVDQTRLGALAGVLSRGTMRDVDVALHWSLGLEH
ncbi:MAG: type II toxin-antitoxin system PemK/MazF family toxin [Dehalococcoidia bacterium]|nr:type II toxin-antitoxin system PemK/MazF family toxin [Dehalococcoidia bacterium]